MPFRNLLAAIVVLLAALSVSLLTPERQHAPLPATATSTSDLATVSNPSPRAESPSPTKATSSAPLPPAPAAPKKTPPAPAQSAPTAPTPPSTSVSDLNSTIGLLRGSLVNIICSSDDSSLEAISGSGVVIDPRGVILTVAHVGQFFLLKNYPHTNGSSCVIRTGSPATTLYKAELAYISPAWIEANKTTLRQTEPSGTGENDFALLVITGSATKAALPSSFPSVSLSHNVPDTGDPVAIGSYGAEFLSSAQVRSALYPIIDFRTIKDRFTFVADTVDLLALAGGAAAQEGSSGGGVLDSANKLVGLITTSTIIGNVSQRTLFATTISHIRRSFLADTGETLDTYISSHTPSALVDAFAPTAENLSSKLISAIGR